MPAPVDRLAVLGLPDLYEVPRYDLFVPARAQPRPAGGDEAIRDPRRFLQQGRRLVQTLQPMGRGRHGEGDVGADDLAHPGHRRLVVLQTWIIVAEIVASWSGIGHINWSMRRFLKTCLSSKPYPP